MKKIVTLALAAMLALSMTAFAGDEPKDTKSCDKAHCKDKKECKLDAKDKHATSDHSEHSDKTKKTEKSE